MPVLCMETTCKAHSGMCVHDKAMSGGGSISCRGRGGILEASLVLRMTRWCALFIRCETRDLSMDRCAGRMKVGARSFGIVEAAAHHSPWKEDER